MGVGKLPFTVKKLVSSLRSILYFGKFLYFGLNKSFVII